MRRKLWEGERRRNEERRKREEERRMEENLGNPWRLGRDKSKTGGEEEMRREEATRSNAQMERRWNELTSSSRWNDAGRQKDEKETTGRGRQETYLGPGAGAACVRTRPGDGGGEDDEDLPRHHQHLSTENMGCSAEARVRRSLEKLNIPSWYTSHPPSPLPSSSLPTSPCPTLRWREGSLSSLPSSPTPGRWRDSPTSPPPRWREASLPPPGPSRQTPVRSNMQLRNSEKPTPGGNAPYLGWRSQEKLPTFLPTQTPSKVESVRQHL